MKFLTLLPVLCVLSLAGCASSAQQKLALDHGPRATSTPWLNQQISEHQANERKMAAGADAPAADTSASH